jgi:hypothetical protein
MANPHRGQVAFKAGDKEYTLSFSINAMCELEDHLELSINQIANKVQDPSQMKMSYLRAIIWAALQDNHPDIDLKTAGAIASEAGAVAVMDAIKACFVAAFPELEAGKKSDPRKAARA